MPKNKKPKKLAKIVPVETKDEGCENCCYTGVRVPLLCDTCATPYCDHCDNPDQCPRCGAKN